MRILLTVPFLTLALASAQPVPLCSSKPSDVPALTVQAESGDPKAQFALGQALSETNDPEKLPMAVYWFQKAAEQGYADAEWRLSSANNEGRGVPRDDKSAQYWFKKAAEDGQPQAQGLLGMNYRDGRSGERDEKKAFYWFLRAAKQGDVDSQYSVAQMYEEGDGVPQDYPQAVNWYKKAAEHVPDFGGAGAALSSLGFLFYQGDRVKQDHVAAYLYFALAANKENMRWVAEKMTTSQIAEAQSRVKEWVRRHPQPRTCSGLPEDSETASVKQK
jgi:TPR repeat protein